MTATIVTILLGAVGSILAAEFLGWCPLLAELLVHRAVRRLTESHRERYRDEWLGDMDVIRSRGGVSLLAWAVGVYLGAGRVARALEPAESDQRNAHCHPTLAEVRHAFTLLLKFRRLSNKATREDRLLAHPTVGPVLLTLLVFIGWTYARHDGRFCENVLRWAKKDDQSIAQ